MDIISNANMDYKIIRSKFNKIIQKLGIILRVPKESISMLKPLIIRDGAHIQFIINTTTYKENHNDNVYKNDLTDVLKQINDFKEALNKNNKNKEILIKEINDLWKLDNNTNIMNIEIHHKQSKMRKKDTINIKLTKVISASDNDEQIYNNNNNGNDNHVTIGGDMEGNDINNESDNDMDIEGDNITTNNNNNINDIDNNQINNDNEIAIQLAGHYNDINNITQGNPIKNETNKPKTLRF